MSVRLVPLQEEAGAGTSGSGGSTPTTPQQPPGGTQPATQAPSTTTPQPPTQEPPQGGQTVPIDQFRAVTQERDRLQREARERDEHEAEQKGEWEKVAKTREGERDQWKERFITTARRSAFIAAIAKDVTDPEAAYKLALADGLLKDVKVDEGGNAEAKAIGEATKATTDAYKFLKAQAGSFGGERSGTQPDNAGFDPNKADGRTLLQEGYRRSAQNRS